MTERPVNPATGRGAQAPSGAAARELTHTIALLFPPSGADRDYPAVQLAFIGGVAETATTHGYDLLLTPCKSGKDPSFRRMVSERRVDGVIVMEVRREDDRIQHLAETVFPFVAIGRNSATNEVSWVDLDFAGLAGGCVRHLTELGHRRIAFVNKSKQIFTSEYGYARLGSEGYTEAMTELELTPRAYPSGDDVAAGEDVVQRILQDDPATTSLVVMNEAALEGIYRGLTRHGRSVPRDFSVVGLGASRWAEQVSPPLTAAGIPAREMSRIAVELMVERLTSPASPPRHVLLKPLITLRASTGPCRPVPDAETEPDFPDLDF
ncbi:LacI family DNA-binding transcriptional regulator [Streptomyces sp. NPDC001922]|uniref:LacI family DNA-binding transcriptional regulator n=1 Tax=Streptomyces sp. NPDC001922 TaxID=3364624 RepID=UPI0036C4C1FC